MSLINDALRDLSAREQSENNVVPENTARTSAPTNRFRFGMLFAIVCTGVLAVSWFSYYKSGNRPVISAVEKPVQLMTPQMVSSETPQRKPVPEAKTTMLVAQEKKAVVEPEENEMQQEDVERLLKKATVALQRDRLSLPAEDNALVYYRKIQLLVPGSDDAREGIAAVLSRYKSLLNQAYTRSDKQQMDYLLTRIDRAGLVFSEKSWYQTKLAEIDSAATPSPEQIETQPSQVSITKTIPSQDIEAVQRARNAVALGDEPFAVRQLLEIINRYERAHLSRLMLFDLYLQRGDIVSARGIATRAGADIIATYLQAKLSVHADELDTARGELLRYSLTQLTDRANAENLPTSFVRDYHALCAALLQKNGDHQQALRYYTVLLQSNFNSAQYWLGYAYSNDALNEQSKALSAYRRVLTLGIEQPSTLAYVQQREKQLASMVLPKTLTEASITP